MDPTETAIDITRISEPSNSQQNQNLSSTQHSNEPDGRRTSPRNYFCYWISSKLVITLSQIIAAIVVLSISKHEHPGVTLFTWIIGYVSGCVATIPLLFWRFHYRNETSDEFLDSVPNLLFALASAFTSFTSDRTSSLDTTLKVVVNYFAIGLDWFFICWTIGGALIFSPHYFASPNLFRLYLAFIFITGIGNLMPFILSVTICILSVTICCCNSCIVLITGFREDLSQNRGASSETINSLPTYKFKIKKHKHGSNRGPHESSFEGGVVAAGTEKERVISGEDAVCCICLGKYANNDKLRELLCSHYFHKHCVDKWLKINALCPLCKSEIGESALI